MLFVAKSLWCVFLYVDNVVFTINGKKEFRIESFENGADDYVEKTFSIKELITKIYIVLRRYHKNNVYEPEKLLQAGDLNYC